VNFFTVVSNVFKSRTNHSGVTSLNILSGESFTLTLIEGFSPLLHNLLHLFDVFLHLLHELIDLSTNLESFVDEGVDVIGVPFEVNETGVESVKHQNDTVLEERLLNGEESREHFVEHSDSNVQVTSLGTVDIDLIEENISTLGHIDIHKLEILDFTEETGKSGVKVHKDSSFFSVVTILLHEKVLVKVFFSVLFNTLYPLFKFLLLKFVEGLLERVKQFLNIFELFTFLDRSGELLETFHRLTHSIEETARPIESTSNWRHVRADRRALINTFDQDLSFLEHNLSLLKVLSEEFEKVNLFAFKLILNDRAVEETFE
jgi:hypothetical protein